MSKLKTISDLEKKCLVGSSWYDNEDNITEYQDFFFDELLFDYEQDLLPHKDYFSEIYSNEGADEIYFQDAVASLYERNNLLEILKNSASNGLFPL